MEKKKRCIGTIIFIMVVSNFSCIFSLLLLNVSFNEKLGIMASIISLGISFILIPFIVVYKWYSVILGEVGIKRLRPRDGILIFLVIIYSIILLYLKRDLYEFMEIGVQQIFVSIAEEFLMRGIIFYLLSSILNKKYWVVIIDAVIFGFLLHTGGDFISNLVYRFTAGIVLTTLRLKTDSLYPPIIVHFMYNLWCIYI